MTVDPMAWFRSPASPSFLCDGDADFSFPDSYLLPVCELSTLKAFLRIAARIVGDKSSIWDLNATSPFSAPGPAPPTSHLRKTWQPTTAQMLIPHDPASWEVGQLLFERWWFIFDSQIIEQSNTWRGMRGAAKLRITGSAARTNEL